ncbi:protein C3orf33 [Anoplolepis gracilipes]|uniref:protein C3orf33 n=1 Tax=Anoplolepis gracilipes TaxID=354296 RepID=UPI003B9DCAE9
MTHEKAPTIFERFQSFMEDEMGPGKLITYGIASAGLFVALYKIKPFAKFKEPSDVPSHFLQSRIPLKGTVMRVEPSHGALLMVNHQPLLPFFNFNNKNYLPVKISGVNITGNGISWLQYVVSGKYITFIPVVKEKKYLECIITMSQKDQDSLKIGEELIKLGLGTIHEPWIKIKDKHISAYEKSLVSAQKWAIRRRNGYWHFIKQPTVLWKMQMFLIDRMKTLLPTYIVRWLDL